MTTEDSSASSAASECTEKIAVMKEASGLLAQGKRNMVCGEIPKAVSLYEEAVQLLVKSCGELSRECADAYFCCGSALLELGRMETNVLGVALQGVDVEEEKEEEGTEQFERPPEDDGEERQKLREDVYDAMAEEGREEEQKKVLLEKPKDSATEGNVDTCDESQKCDMETDVLEENGVEEKKTATVTSDNKKNNISEEPSSTIVSAKNEEGIATSVCDDSKQEEKVDDRPAKSAEVTSENNVHITGDKEKAAVPASEESEQQEKMDDSPAEEKRSNVEENSVASGDHKHEDKIDDGASGNIGEGSSKIETGNEDSVAVSASEESTQQEKLVGSSSECTEDSGSKMECEKGDDNAAVSVSDNNKQEEKINANPLETAEENITKIESDKEDSAPVAAIDNNKQVEKIVDVTDTMEENSSNLAISDSKPDESAETSGKQDSCIESANQEEALRTSEKIQKEEQKVENGQADKIENKIIVETATNAENLIEDQKESNSCGEELNTQNGTSDADKTEKILTSDGAVAASHAGESDVDMADDDDECENTEDDMQESEENGVNEKEEDVPNFQLAWEYLDLAKVLFLKSESVDDQLKAADCYLKLGELSMETEQYTVAAEDLESALKIHKKHLPANDRLIAETNYQLGLAYGLGGEYERSIQNYTQAIGVIESKIESLSELVTEIGVDGENKENLKVDQLKKYKDEIKELQELIPEIKIKIEDIKQEAIDVEQMKQMAKEALGFVAPSKELGSPAKIAETVTADNGSVLDDVEKQKASDIGHLVRKKRKPDSDLSETEEQEIKKLRSDGDCTKESCIKSETVNGASEPDANIADKDTNIADKDTNMADEDTNMADEDTNMADEDTNMADGDINMAGGDAVIADKETNIAGEDAVIADGGAVIADGDAVIADVDAVIADKDTDIAEKDTDIADKDTNIAGENAIGDAVIADGNSNITDAAVIADKDKVIAVGDTVIPDKDTNIVDGDAVADKKSTNIADGGAVIPDKDTNIADGDAVVADKNTNIADGGAVIPDKDTNIADGDAVVADKNTNIADGDAVIDDKDTYITDGDTNIADEGCSVKVHEDDALSAEPVES